MFKGAKAPAAPIPQGALPPEGTRVRLRLTVGNDAGDALVVEVPSLVSDVERGDSPTRRTRVLISAPDVSFLPAAPNFTVEQGLIWTTASGQMEVPVLVTETDQPSWWLVTTGPARRLQRR